ncbi:MAG: hypothetical protein B6D61_08130 [Bacteroidetes bacterium 4484_249]|nr:MAG: hypothetical protein B6D61_08130 [Bacteroidetes bacterium 4484_249]
MKKLFIIFFIVSSLNTIAQNITKEVNNKDTLLNYRKNIVSVEIGGNGIIYSVNYSRIIGRNFITRLGFEYGGNTNNNLQLIFPVEFYLRTGYQKHHFEIGAGISFFTNEGLENDF